MRTNKHSDRRARQLSLELLDALAELNGGRYPSSTDEWIRLARRVDLDVEIGPPGMREAEFNHDLNVVIVPPATSISNVLEQFMHEIGERALLREWRPPFRYPPELGDDHDIAKAAEAPYAAWLRRQGHLVGSGRKW